MYKKEIEAILKYPEDFEKTKQRFYPISIEMLKTINAAKMHEEFEFLNKSHENEQDFFSKENKDRYRDVKPYFHNKIICQGEGYYLNASIMRSLLDDKIYAYFGQAPPPSQFEEFWQAIYEHNVKKIIMLCALGEKQADQYWPKEETFFPKLNIKIANISTKNDLENLQETVFKINGPEGIKTVEHIHWFGWGDMKKPLGEQNIIIFRKIVNIFLESIEKNELVFVHCSAGIGRTGTLGAVVEGIRIARKTGHISIPAIIDHMRRYRMGVVQTFQQYQFIYQQISEIL